MLTTVLVTCKNGLNAFMQHTAALVTGAKSSQPKRIVVTDNTCHHLVVVPKAHGATPRNFSLLRGFTPRSLEDHLQARPIPELTLSLVKNRKKKAHHQCGNTCPYTYTCVSRRRPTRQERASRLAVNGHIRVQTTHAQC